MPLPVKSFPELIRVLADTHHHGSIYDMARRSGISNAALDKWAKDMVQHPSHASLAKLARVYDIDLYDLIALVYGPESTPAKPGKRPGRRGPFVPISGGSDAAHPLPVGSEGDEKAHYVACAWQLIAITFEVWYGGCVQHLLS